MSYVWPGLEGLDYLPCSYGNSRLTFRGPPRPLDGAYCAVLGGIETFGKFVPQPYPALLESRTGLRVVNFGCAGAGPDTFLQDETVLEAARNAGAVVIQIPGAQNLSNRYYAVHPRRNDRFIRAEADLHRLYPEVDFSEFSFTRHLVQSLWRRGPKRFARVRAALQATWVERMSALLGRIGGPVVTLWLSDRLSAGARAPDGGHGPLLVSRAMLKGLASRSSGLVEIIRRTTGIEPDAGMVCAPIERRVAAALPGPEPHDAAAEALAPLVARLMAQQAQHMRTAW